MGKNTKYIVRKSARFDLDDLEKSQVSFSSFFQFIDRILFTKPLRSFSFLIIVGAFPLALFLTLRRGPVLISSRAMKRSVNIQMQEINTLKANKQISLPFNILSRGVEDLTFIEVLTPPWLSQEGYVQQESPTLLGEYGHVVYSGVAPFEVTDRFVLLIKGKKLESASVCNGCDKDSLYAYNLAEFNLNTTSCEQTQVWGRNPIGYLDVEESDSFCIGFKEKCLVSDSWVSYDSSAECTQARDGPEFIKTIEDKIYTFEVGCDGSFEKSEFYFDETIEAKDRNGDIVRMRVYSPGDFVHLEQDSIETIVKQVSSTNQGHYSDFVYSATVKGSVDSTEVSKTIPVKITACDILGDCTEKEFDISLVRRSSCKFILPETGAVNVNISSPAEGSEFRGIDNVVWTMEGSEYFYTEVNLYEDDCKTYITNVARFNKLTLDGSKGYAVSFDSRKYDDGEYCIGVFAREDPVGSNWDGYHSQVFAIRNDNQNPSITSNPDNTNLNTGEQFQYEVVASDPDGDSLNFDVIGLPVWLTFESNIISGSTVIPGTYNCVVFVDDDHEGYTTQQISLNVTPPVNQISEIGFIFPQAGSVLSGQSNSINFSVGDPDGINLISLYYSIDGEQWNMIDSFAGGTTEVNWDVSSLANGAYFLRLLVRDGSIQQVETSEISDQFYISNPEEPEEEEEEQTLGEDTSMPAINNLTPKPNSETSSKLPLISASLHPSNSAEIQVEKVEVYLDDDKITLACDISKEEVLCQLESELGVGRHKVRIEIEDTKDKKMTEEWYFTIIESITEEDTESEDVIQLEDDYIMIPIINREISKSALIVSGVLCCAALLLIIIPWLVYFLWNRRRSGGEQPGVVSEERHSPIPPTPTPSQGDDIYKQSVYDSVNDASQDQSQGQTIYKPEPIEPSVPDETSQSQSIPQGSKLYKKESEIRSI